MAESIFKQFRSSAVPGSSGWHHAPAGKYLSERQERTSAVVEGVMFKDPPLKGVRARLHLCLERLRPGSIPRSLRLRRSLRSPEGKCQTVKFRLLVTAFVIQLRKQEGLVRKVIRLDLLPLTLTGSFREVQFGTTV